MKSQKHHEKIFTTCIMGKRLISGYQHLTNSSIPMRKHFEKTKLGKTTERILLVLNPL